MLHPPPAPARTASLPIPPSPPAAAPAEGLLVTVTTHPLTAAGPACTPELAAWLVREGLAVALVDETAGDARQLLHLLAASPLVDELYAERFAAPHGSARTAATAVAR